MNKKYNLGAMVLMFLRCFSDTVLWNIRRHILGTYERAHKKVIKRVPVEDQFFIRRLWFVLLFCIIQL